MNSDEFEKRLEHQPFAPVPTAWRNEILASAKAASGNVLKRSKITPWWREALWPFPQAWASLAAVWLLILTLNYFAKESETQIATSKSVSQEAVAAIREQRRFYLELAGLGATPVTEPPKDAAPKPTSERRKEIIYA